MEKKNLKIFLILLIIVGISYFFYNSALTQPTYEGLPTVPCINYTKKAVQDYSLYISISIMGKNYPIPNNYGHDYGQCLHDIYVNNSSGLIFVKTNEQEGFELGNFFDIWHATFNNDQIFGYLTGANHTLEVFLNGKKVNNLRQIPLFPNANIKIVYK